MQRSNLYVLSFAAILTIVCGGLLAFANQGLKDRQEKEKQLDTRKNILGAVMDVEGKSKEEINNEFNSKINGYVIDNTGAIDESLEAESVDPKRVYKTKDVSEKRFPVFEYKEGDQITAYIFPVFGKGLWDDVWGYVALEADANTIKGVVFAHKGETPGLGARITEKIVQKRFVGKEIVGGGVAFIKGEGVPANIKDKKHEVDGLSGATMTTRGVNKMLENYFGYYEEFLKTKRN